MTVAGRYDYSVSDEDLISLKPGISKRGFIEKVELQQIAYWKAPRSSGHARRNSAEYVREVTAFALIARTERARIESLTILDGVSWPTESVILHFFHTEPYPIMDVRALWSVGLDMPNHYTFAFWWRYVEICREVADRNRVDMRTLDRALWQYSKENQPST